MAIQDRLSELEGAVLTEIGPRGHTTSFKVRQAFRRSPSSSWSGSAGAVYPAIARLVAAGLIATTATDSARGTRLLALTAAGRAALEEWACDIAAACTIGTDPFRMRAGIWKLMAPGRRRDVLLSMIEGVKAEAAKLEGRTDLDPMERVGNDLARAQQASRLAWLEDALRETASVSPPDAPCAGSAFP